MIESRRFCLCALDLTSPPLFFETAKTASTGNTIICSALNKCPPTKRYLFRPGSFAATRSALRSNRDGCLQMLLKDASAGTYPVMVS